MPIHLPSERVSAAITRNVQSSILDGATVAFMSHTRFSAALGVPLDETWHLTPDDARHYAAHIVKCADEAEAR